MLAILWKGLKFSSILLTTLILCLGKARGTTPKIEIAPEFVERSHWSVMEIQQVPINLQASIPQQQNNFVDKIDSELINYPNYSQQKVNFTPCIHRESECKFSQITPAVPNQSLIHQLSDIEPKDWAYTAIKSLIKRHKLQLNTYFGNQIHGNSSLTRYEFAVIVNDVVTRIFELNQTNSPLKLTQTELQVLQKIQTELKAELNTLNTRIDKLEQKTSADISQFFTTIKLTGEALFALSAAATSENKEGNLTLASLIRLNFNSSFTGKDNLRIRLQARNLPKFDDVTETDMARLAFQGSTNNRIEISRLDYSFPINKQLRVNIPVIGGSLRDFTDPLNPYLAGSSRGAISRFAQRNPIYRHGSGSGIGLSYEINDSLELEAGFLARDANNPETGLNRGSYGAIAQLTIEPIEDMEFGLTYIRSYNNLDTGTGSERANDPFDDNSNAISANSFGLQSSIKISPNFSLGGWIGYTNATALDLPNNPSANILNWALTLGFPNLGGEENLAGVAIGQPPKVINSNFTYNSNNQISDVESDTSIHLEAFYRLQVQENIAISLGLLTIINPEHNSNNNTVHVGTIRTTLNF